MYTERYSVTCAWLVITAVLELWNVHLVLAAPSPPTDPSHVLTAELGPFHWPSLPSVLTAQLDSSLELLQLFVVTVAQVVLLARQVVPCVNLVQLGLPLTTPSRPAVYPANKVLLLQEKVTPFVSPVLEAPSLTLRVLLRVLTVALAAFKQTLAK